MTQVAIITPLGRGLFPVRTFPPVVWVEGVSQSDNGGGADGSFVYEAPLDFAGFDAFSYQVARPQPAPSG